MKKPTLRERLLSKAVINWETGCWEWIANRHPKGYALFSVNNKTSRAHRVAYELIEGPIPEGLHLDHLCRVRHCINPAHLEPVTPVENNLRSRAVRSTTNTYKTHCHAGHEFTPENTCMRTRPDGRIFRACRTCQIARQRRRQSETTA